MDEMLNLTPETFSAAVCVSASEASKCTLYQLTCCIIRGVRISCCQRKGSEKISSCGFDAEADTALERGDRDDSYWALSCCSQVLDPCDI